MFIYRNDLAVGFIRRNTRRTYKHPKDRRRIADLLSALHLQRDGLREGHGGDDGRAAGGLHNALVNSSRHRYPAAARDLRVAVLGPLAAKPRRQAVEFVLEGLELGLAIWLVR